MDYEDALAKMRAIDYLYKRPDGGPQEADWCVLIWKVLSGLFEVETGEELMLALEDLFPPPSVMGTVKDIQ